MVSLWVPVTRSVERIEEPSVRRERQRDGPVQVQAHRPQRTRRDESERRAAGAALPARVAEPIPSPSNGGLAAGAARRYWWRVEAGAFHLFSSPVSSSVAHRLHK